MDILLLTTIIELLTNEDFSKKSLSLSFDFDIFNKRGENLGELLIMD